MSMAEAKAVTVSKEIARSILHTYFTTNPYPYTQHHIDSYDQFVQEDMIHIIRSQNPIILVKELLDDALNLYMYRVKIYVGGLDGSDIEIGTPTLHLKNGDDIRMLFPNEARLRNLTYASTVYARIHVCIEYRADKNAPAIDLSPPADTFQNWELFKLPIMLHSQYCILHQKPKRFLQQVGECVYDHGGYFIIDGAEKVLITRQEQAFNTLYITKQSDPKVSIYASIQCLSATTRQVKRVAFALMRQVIKKEETIHPVIQVVLPMVRAPIPLFILFRAMGFQSDEDALHLIFPDFESAEAQILLPRLRPSILEADPYYSQYACIEYIKYLTKGHTEATVIDILRNQMFIHLPSFAADAVPSAPEQCGVEVADENLPREERQAKRERLARWKRGMMTEMTTKALYLGECIRRILRVSEDYDTETDRDDTRNQRCLTSGFLIQELFSHSYKMWIKAFSMTIGKEYMYNRELYANERFANIFQSSNANRIFHRDYLAQLIMQGFKGKWGTGLGEEKTGVLQVLSRLSYTDFMSHCRRVILDFDTGMKLTGPRKLHPSQYGYFCTSETPTGASIGITKNMSILTAISTASDTKEIAHWLVTYGGVFYADQLTIAERARHVPVYINGGMFGYTRQPRELTAVLKQFKRCGALPYSASVSFPISERRVQLYLDAGRPLRPLIWVTRQITVTRDRIEAYRSWEEMVIGPRTRALQDKSLHQTRFVDPFAAYHAKQTLTLREYLQGMTPERVGYGMIEYIDPYEQNESFIANVPEYILPKTTTHVEIHPSTILSMMTCMIPFAQHNQSPRNQLSCSQSKQGCSIYATNWQNRFDNTAHILCYGEMPMSRTLYNNYFGEGRMAYGMNCMLAIGCWKGYNQEDGIVMNKDSVDRGMFRSIQYKSYEFYEEDDDKANVSVRIGNPARVAIWKEIAQGVDYSKLDDRGIIREGEYVDETTVIVGGYMIQKDTGQIKDASLTAQVWTHGRVEKVAVMVNNLGLRLVKIRVVQDRSPELGDKFCLTADHEVLLSTGEWRSIAAVTTADSMAQRHPVSGQIEYVQPTATYVFGHIGEMYLIQAQLPADVLEQYVTADHRMYLRINGVTGLFKAVDVYRYWQQGPTVKIEMITVDETYAPVTRITITPVNQRGDKVYCVSVPSEVFLVRSASSSTPTWTGNSNRHGQKGTIGALLRSVDLPHTIDGIVPDMIMNPHAIPSRMTIAQNLEQLLGKAVALTGAIGDATAFMNDESPQQQIGEILLAHDFEPYGNEVFYNGETGEQMTAAIFIGPIYGMRLKHMVEDKWQARGKGRKEVRTHQPTAGRGAQGGLKIGEMDRDAIIAHGGMAFVKEAFMERSDKAVIPICASCGTVPIYNPAEKIALCSTCDGPVQYSGDSVNTLDLLPPIGRPKSRIVQVEMPFATKLLAQEQETFLNLSMRFITGHGVTHLTPLEYKDTGKAVLQEFTELPLLALPIMEAAPLLDIPEDQSSVSMYQQWQELVSEKAALEQKKGEEHDFEEDNPAAAAASDSVDGFQPVLIAPEVRVGQPQASAPLAVQAQLPSVQAQLPSVQLGGATNASNGVVMEVQVVPPIAPMPITPTTSQGSVITVDTTYGGFVADGIVPDVPGMGLGYRLPRRHGASGHRAPPVFGGGGGSLQSMSTGPMPSTGTFTIHKME